MAEWLALIKKETGFIYSAESESVESADVKLSHFEWLIEQAELAQKYLAALKGIDLNIHDTKQVSEILDIALEEQHHGNY